MIKILSMDELEERVRDGNMIDSKIPILPSNTQAVERTIKIVTEASQNVMSAKSRDVWIRKRMASRAKMPKFDSKQDFGL